MTSNEMLNTVLEDGETVQWSGAPQPYSLFDPSRKGSTYTTLCLAVAWGVLSVGGYYASGVEVKTGLVVFLLAVSGLIIWIPISDKSKVKKLLYAITDKKAIVASQENKDPIILPIADIDDVRVDTADNGNCHVRLGTPVFKVSSRKLPVLAYRGEYDDIDGNKKYKGVVLFNIKAEDGKLIKNLLRK